MNYEALDTMLSFILNANDQQAPTEFDEDRRKQALNAAYKREWNEIQLHVSRSAKLAIDQFTWPSGAVTCVIPTRLQGKTIQNFYDITNNTGQPPRLIVSFQDQNTLQWFNSSGPSADITIRVAYVASPTDLNLPDDSPDLLLEQYHELIVWSAAIWLTEIMDREEAPATWNKNYEKLLSQAIKGMSNRPLGDPTQIGGEQEDSGDYA